VDESILLPPILPIARAQPSQIQLHVCMEWLHPRPPSAITIALPPSDLSITSIHEAAFEAVTFAGEKVIGQPSFQIYINDLAYSTTADLKHAGLQHDSTIKMVQIGQ
jgi:hypothetical protein